jgi:hypothetical protein
MGSQHCGRGYDSATLFKHMRFKHMGFKHMGLKKSGSDASCIAAATVLSSRLLRTSRYFGGSVSLKLENFQAVC